MNFDPCVRALKRRVLPPAAIGLALVCAVATAHASDEIVIGASVPLSGPLAGLGSYEQWGYKRAVDEVNKAGGLSIGGQKHVVRLINGMTRPTRARSPATPRH